MIIYTVTRRRGRGLAEAMPATQFPAYKIAADSPLQAKKVACRLDRLDECFWRLYIATPEKTKTHRPATTDRCGAASKKDAAGMKTTISISRAFEKCNSEVLHA